MKRIPILANDTYLDFKHISKETKFKVKTPKHEEIYANKLVTLLSRATPRDLYDVASFSETSADLDTLRKCTIIESLMSLKQPITKIKPQKIINKIPYDERIRTVSKQPSTPDIKETRQKAATYTNKIFNSLSESEKQCIKTFYKDKKIQTRPVKPRTTTPRY